MANDGQVIIDVELNSDKVVKEAEQAGKKIGDSFNKNVNKAVNDVEKNVGKIGTAFNKINVGNLSKQFEKVDLAINKTNSNIEKQKQKLEDLKSAYNNTNDAKSQEKIAQQMKNTELNIARAEKQLDKLNNKKVNLNNLKDSANGLDGNFSSASMKATKSLDNIGTKAEETGKKVKKSFEDSTKNIALGESVSEMGNSLSDVGNNLSTKVTLPIVAMGAAALKTGADFGSQMSRVKAISGATGEEFKQLHDQALQLGKDTAFSAKSAAEGMEGLAAAGFTTQETMAAMPGLLDLAASSGESLATSTDIAASTLRGFGLEANQAGHVADVLAKNANATNAAVADTGEAMKYIAPVAHSMGLSLEEVTAAIGELANSGIQGSQAGTTLRSALTRLASPAKEAKDAMASIGFSAFDSQGKLKGFSTIIDEYNKALEGKTDQQKQDLTATIFGQEAMSGMLVLMQGGKKGLDDLTNSYKSADGAAKDMATTMQDNSKSAIEQMTGSIETAAIKLEEVAAPTITKIANEVQDMANAFADLSPEMQETIIKTALFAAAAGPVTKIVGGVTSGIGSIIGLLSKFAPTITSTVVATEGLASVGTVGAASLGGFVAAAAPFVLAAATIGTVGYGIYDTMTKKVVPSVDLFADQTNITTENIKNQYGNMQQSITGSTTKISDATKQAVQSYLDMNNDAKKYLQDLFVNNSTITEQIASDTKSKFDNMANAAINGYEKQKNEGINKLNELFTKEKSLTSEEQSEILRKTSEYYSSKESKVRSDEARINEIISTASSQKRSLTKDELSEIQNLQNDMRDNAVSALSQQQSETAVILQRMKDYDGQITAEQASEKIKALNDSRDKAVQAANDEYDQKIAVITDMRDNVGSITAEEADKMIEEAKRQRDETVQAAQDTRDGAVSKIEDMNSTISSEVDTNTGNILTYWDKLKAWWDGWNPQPKTVTITTQDQAVSNAYNNAMNSQPWAQNNPYLQIGQANYTGSNSPQEGLSNVDEHGYETAKKSNIKMLKPGLAYISSHAVGGDGINDHMTTVNEMHNDITSQVGESIAPIVNALISSLSSQGVKLNQIATNTAETVNATQETNKLSEDLANNIVNQYKNSTAGSFSNLNIEIETANKAKEKADKTKVEDNSNYASLKSQVDNLKADIEDLDTTIDNTTDEGAKKQLEAQKKVLKAKQDSIEKEMDLAKMVAENEIQSAKDSADQQVKIAEDKKDKLTKIAEATTTAIKNEYEAQKKLAEDAINAELKTLETNYNNKVKEIEDNLKSKTDEIDKNIKDLEKKSTDNSRDQERAESNDNINKLTTMMNNTASAADKRSLQLQIDEAKKSLQEKEDAWSIEDQKQALEDEKSLLNERADNRKKSLEEQYNQEKEEKEKELKNIDAYYEKLMQEDSINARARYLLLQGNSNELVQLLQSYNPQWQDAGQSLADSLLSGLNSKKETISQAVNEMIMLRTGSTYGSESKKTGYASGTSYNQIPGYYLTNEYGWETSDRGDVAYVSKGASIKNKMQSIADMKAEISRQLSNDLPYITSQLNATMQAEQAETRRMMSNVVNNTTSNSQNIQYDGSNNFNIETLILQNHDDVEQLFNEAESVRTSKRPF